MRRYRVLVADPAWAFRDRLTMTDVKRGAESQYPVLDNAAIRALRVERLMEDDAVGVLWYPDALLRVAVDVFAAWGFRQTQQWTWVKTGKDAVDDGEGNATDETAMAFGMGRLARNCAEHALVGVRGSPYEHLRNRSQRNVFLHPALPHSAKPEGVQDALDRMFPEGNRLELFARRARPGWTCIGNQCEGTVGRDIRACLADLATIPR